MIKTSINFSHNFPPIKTTFIFCLIVISLLLIWLLIVGIRQGNLGLLFFENCSTLEFFFNSWICFNAFDKEISDCCAMIFLPFEGSSSNDILKFFADLI